LVDYAQNLKNSINFLFLIRWLGSTQFQATSARRALPCFDEPKFKAVFKLTMDRPTSYNPSLSNTRIQSSEVLPDATRTREIFHPTPIMSSYLLAFVVSEYEGRPNPTGDQATFARPAAFDQTLYSMNFADAVLKEFDTFTDYAYLSVPAIEKLDQAAVPDFSAGAMENWGLMTYR
jgi:aminopeptidase N